MDAINPMHAETQDGARKHHSHTKAAGVTTINLALQGGGAHGAFTWGVLDRLLEEEKLGFDCALLPDRVVDDAAVVRSAYVMVSMVCCSLSLNGRSSRRPPAARCR